MKRTISPPVVVRARALPRPFSRPSRPRYLLLTLSVAALLASACGGSGDGGTTTNEAGAGPPTVVISNFEFSPDTLQVRVGDVITVDNKDSAEHSVTAVDKSFDSGRFAKGTRTFTVTKAGRFEYVCDVHPFMPHKFIQVSG